MIGTTQNNFILSVQCGFNQFHLPNIVKSSSISGSDYCKTAGESSPLLYEVNTWLDHIVKVGYSDPEIETQAQAILKTYPELKISTDSKRYKFHKTNKDELMKVIFNQAYEKSADDMISIVGKLHGTTLYPTWKKITYIDIPKNVGDFLDSSLTKSIASLTALIASYELLYISYQALTNAISNFAIPYLINNSHPLVVQLGNTLVEGTGWFSDHIITILLASYVIKRVVLALPEIPVLSPAIRKVSVVKLFITLVLLPQSMFGFAVWTSFSNLMFTYRECSRIGQNFKHIALKANNERLADYKKVSFEMWKQAVYIPQVEQKAA